MTKLTMLSLFISWGTIIINNPYLMATLFGQMLILVTVVLCLDSKFIGLIMFLVYVGGIMVLISYCVMLLPDNKFPVPVTSFLPVLLIILLSFPTILPLSALPFGLLLSASAIYILGMLLYLVLLAIVGIIDYSSGMLKP